MDLSIFFQALDEEFSPQALSLTTDQWGKQLPRYLDVFPNWEQADLVLVGCQESRGSALPGLEGTATAIRRELYRLSAPHNNLRMVDLGDLRPKESPEAYQEMMTYVLTELLQAGKTILCIGGSQDLTYAQYLAFESQEDPLEYVQVDARFDVEDSEWKLDNHSYNHKIFLHEPNYLFQYTNLGYQRYLVSEQQRKGLDALHYSALRYGELSGNIELVEPYLRTAHLISVDFSSLRRSEAPAAAEGTPGGFTATEACRIARYAGLGFQSRIFSLSEMVPAWDIRNTTAQIGAMMLWYFADGFYNRKGEQSRPDRSQLRQYTVRLHATVAAIDFYRHPTSGRWWMAVPYPDSLPHPHKRSLLVPCSEREYEFAKRDDIPQRWWQVFHQLGG